MADSATGVINDGGWIRRALFVPDVASEVGGVGGITHRATATAGSVFSTASMKFTDTTPGGNFVLNPRTQICRNADPKLPGINPMSRGMGMLYSEMYDDTKEVIHLQFGMPDYNSLLSFWTNYYSTSMGKFANTGDARGFFFNAGYVLGFALTAPFQVINGVVNMVNRLWHFANNTPYSKFYYMRPTMPLFIERWTSVFNRIAVGMGIVNGPDPKSVASVKTSETNGEAVINYRDGLSSSEFEVLQRMLPDVMRSDGGIDLYALMTRGQRLANAHYARLNQIEKSVEGQGQEAYKNAVLSAMQQGSLAVPPPKYKNLPDYLKDFYQAGKIGQGAGAVDPKAVIDANADGASVSPSTDKAAAADAIKQSVNVARFYDDASMLDYFKGELTDGAAFLSLEVEYNGEVTESFSNTFRKSSMEELANSTSSSGRGMMFNFAHGNLGDGPLAQTVESVFGAVKNFASGALASVGLDGLSQMGGAAYADMPEFWDMASADMPASSYTINLYSQYGNKFAILMKLYTVVSAMLAATLPISSGRNSYTSPFLCSLFSQSKAVIPLGMIESLSIRRGSGGLGWTDDKLPRHIQIDFTVKNMSTIMHAPITDKAGIGGMASLSMLDEDNLYTDYMKVLSGLSLADQYYFTPRLKLAWRQQVAAFESWTSPARWASHMAGTDTTANRLIGAFMRETTR